MSRLKKLIDRFKQKPSDYSFEELKKMLNGLGYLELKLGKTSGSRVAFINEKSKHIIRMHKPHPRNILKKYQVELILDELLKRGII